MKFAILFISALALAQAPPLTKAEQLQEAARKGDAATVKRLLDEGLAVAKAQGVELIHPDLYEVLFDTCEKSASNLSSMLQDILNEMATEIDAQNGAICRYAEEHGISVPTHRTMVELIKLLECWKPGVGQA